MADQGQRQPAVRAFGWEEEQVLLLGWEEWLHLPHGWMNKTAKEPMKQNSGARKSVSPGGGGHDEAGQVDDQASTQG